MMDRREFDVERTVAENEERHKKLKNFYNPASGQGGVGRRKRMKVAWEDKLVWLPQTMLDDPEWKRVRSRDEYIKLRFRHDFEFWTITCVKIRHKVKGGRVAFRLNRPQRRVLAMFEEQRMAGRPLRIIMLKARQWGGSTLVQMYFAWIQCVHCRNWNSLICAHVRNSAANIRGMYSQMLNDYPRELWEGEEKPEFRPFEGSATTREIAGRSCNVTLTSSYGQDSSRGLDIQLAHLSEVAYWRDTDQNSPSDFVRAVCGGIVDAPLTAIVLESTANGTGNFFHSEWLRATAGESDKQAVFVPWHEIEMYSMKIERSIGEFLREMDSYQWELWEKGLTLEQINWYRHTRRSYTSHRDMMAEYPTTDVEAFSVTGSGIFDSAIIDRLMSGTMPGDRGSLEGRSQSGRDALANLHFVAGPLGLLEVWARPAEGIISHNRYVAAVDVGGRTRGADYSVITVLDRFSPLGKPAIVAQWRGHIDHDLLGWQAAALAHWYGDALLVVESNTLESGREGESRYILEELNQVYRNIYARRVRDTINGGVERRLGFHTNQSTKSMIIASLISSIRDNRYFEPSVEAVKELAVYEQKDNGSYGAKRGHHDDIVMTRAMALYVAGTLGSVEEEPVDVAALLSPGF